jgi:hypothetical protein
MRVSNVAEMKLRIAELVLGLQSHFFQGISETMPMKKVRIHKPVDMRSIWIATMRPAGPISTEL